MIQKCPKCRSTDHLQIERRPDGDILCMNCNHKDVYAAFNFRTQHLEEIFEIISELAQKDIRVGQIFKIIETAINNKGKRIFYVENDELLEELKKMQK